MIYIEVVSKRVEQRMNEILLRINNNAALESIPSAGSERYLQHEILISAWSCGNVFNFYHIGKHVALKAMTYLSI